MILFCWHLQVQLSYPIILCRCKGQIYVSNRCPIYYKWINGFGRGISFWEEAGEQSEPKVSRYIMSVSPHFHWLNSFATVLSEFHWQVQWPILNNSHAYPFCKTTPGTLVLAIALGQWNSHKTFHFFANFGRESIAQDLVAKLFSQWKWRCTILSTGFKHKTTKHIHVQSGLCKCQDVGPVANILL